MKKFTGLFLLACGLLAPAVSHSIVWNPFTGKPDYTGTSAGTYINNQVTLQTGSTFYVSSGTINSFTATNSTFTGTAVFRSTVAFADGTSLYTGGFTGGISVSSITTTSASTQAVTALDFPIGANETWSFDYFIFNGCDNTGGTKFALEAPSGAVYRSVAYGTAATGTAFRIDRIETTFHFKFASTTGTQTSAINVGSHVNARRLP
jgi:hypothetical protein